MNKSFFSVVQNLASNHTKMRGLDTPPIQSSRMQLAAFQVDDGLRVFYPLVVMTSSTKHRLAMGLGDVASKQDDDGAKEERWSRRSSMGRGVKEERE